MITREFSVVFKSCKVHATSCRLYVTSFRPEDRALSAPTSLCIYTYADLLDIYANVSLRIYIYADLLELDKGHVFGPKRRDVESA